MRHCQEGRIWDIALHSCSGNQHEESGYVDLIGPFCELSVPVASGSTRPSTRSVEVVVRSGYGWSKSHHHYTSRGCRGPSGQKLWALPRKFGLACSSSIAGSCCKFPYYWRRQTAGLRHCRGVRGCKSSSKWCRRSRRYGFASTASISVRRHSTHCFRNEIGRSAEEIRAFGATRSSFEGPLQKPLPALSCSASVPQRPSRSILPSSSFSQVEVQDDLEIWVQLSKLRWWRRSFCLSLPSWKSWL